MAHNVDRDGRLRVAFALAFGFWACAPAEFPVKSRLVVTETPIGFDVMNVCRENPFGALSFDFGKDLAEAGIDLSQGCIKTGGFELSAELVDYGPGDGCDSPRGTITLSQVTLTASCSNGTTAEPVRARCTSNALSVADSALFSTLNDCLDELERTQVEPIRRLINACKPTRLAVALEGTCSSDLCVRTKLKVGLRTKDVVVQLGNTCP